MHEPVRVEPLNAEGPPELECLLGGAEVLGLSARRSNASAVNLWLRQSRARPLGLEAVRLSPALPALPPIDEPYARALVRHLTQHHRFDLLELDGLAATSPLVRAAQGMSGPRFSVRVTEGPPRATLVLERDLDAWFEGLDGFGVSLARRTRSLMAAGELELISSDDPRAGPELDGLYRELRGRSTASGSSPPTGALALGGAALFELLLLDGLPIAATASLKMGARLVQLEALCDSGFEEAGPDEVLVMLAARDALCRGFTGLELCPSLVPRHQRLGATLTPTVQVRVYRRFGPHHLLALWRRLWRTAAPPAPPPAPGRSDFARQLRARTDAAEALDRLDKRGAQVQRLWGDPLRAALPFDPHWPENERVRRAV